MSTRYYTVKQDPTHHYYVTDGIWESARYTRTYARKVLADALWGSTGADGRGTYADHRIIP
jgi:hypothetical protein